MTTCPYCRMEVPGGNLCPYCRSDLTAHNAREAEGAAYAVFVAIGIVVMWPLIRTIVWLICAIFNGILWMLGAFVGVILGHWILISVIVIAAVVFLMKASNAVVTDDAAKPTALIDDLA